MVISAPGTKRLLPLITAAIVIGGLVWAAGFYLRKDRRSEKTPGVWSSTPKTILAVQDSEVKQRRRPANRKRAGASLFERAIAGELRPINQSQESEGEGNGREGWFYDQRAYPLKTIPRGAYQQAFDRLELYERERREEREQAIMAGEMVEPEPQLVWASIGPAPIDEGQTFGFPRHPVSGRVTSIVLDPGYNGVENRTLYLGGAQGGVWKSIDNGLNWSPIFDDQRSLAIGTVAIDPTNPQVIYVGTGEGHLSGDSYYGAGLFKSIDGGATWVQITGPISTTPPNLPSFINAAFLSLVIDPSNPSTLYAATVVGRISGPNGSVSASPLGNRGIWKSTDGGMTWRNLNPGGFTVDRSGTEVLVDPRNAQRVLAAILNVGIYRSNQGGEPGTWIKLSGGLPDPGPDLANSPFVRIEIASGPPIPPSNASTFYAAFGAADSTLLGIWRSTDGGENWARVTTPQSQGQANYNLAITVDPVDGNIVYYGTSANTANTAGTLFRSRDGGQSWSDISVGDSGGLHADTHVIVVSPANRNIIFTGNDGGVWRADNGQSNILSWKSLNLGLSITQFQAIALHPTDPNVIVGGTQDNGTPIYRGATNWAQIRAGDGGFALIDQSNPQVIYHTFYNQDNSDGQRPQIGPEVSLSGGLSWQRRGCFGCTAVPGNFNPSDRVAFYAPMAQHTGFTDQNNGNVIYFGTKRLYRTADRGLNWLGVGPSADGFGADLTKGAGWLTAIAAHPSRVNGQEIVWIGANDGTVQVTTNAGDGSSATFSNLTRHPLPNRFVTDIGLDRANPERAVVTFSGFNISTPDTPGHVFITDNRGQSWTDISGNLPDVPVSSVAINPNNPQTIYLGTDLGVFQTSNQGASWERLGNGMPRVATFMVRYHAATNTLVAATHGRGVFRLTTSRSLATVSAADFAASSIATESIVSAFGLGLASRTAAGTTIPLPTMLAGSRISLRDSAGVVRLAPIFFVSPSQANFQIPPGSAAGPATITITGDDGTVSSGSAEIATVAPSLFSANANGKGVAAGLTLQIRPDNTQVYRATSFFDNSKNQFIADPIDLGSTGDQTFLLLFGSGIRFRSSLSNVTATVGGIPVQVYYAGPQADYVGLDQVNILLPRELAGRGNVEIALTVDNKPANILSVSFK